MGKVTNAGCLTKEDFSNLFPECDKTESTITSVVNPDGSTTYTHNGGGDGSADTSWTTSTFGGADNGVGIGASGKVELGEEPLNRDTTITMAGNDLNLVGGDVNIGTANSDSTDTYFPGIDANTAKGDCSNTTVAGFRNSDGKLVPFEIEGILNTKSYFNVLTDVGYLQGGNETIGGFFPNRRILHTFSITAGCEKYVPFTISAEWRMEGVAYYGLEVRNNSDVYDFAIGGTYGDAGYIGHSDPAGGFVTNEHPTRNVKVHPGVNNFTVSLIVFGAQNCRMQTRPHLVIDMAY